MKTFKTPIFFQPTTANDRFRAFQSLIVILVSSLASVAMATAPDKPLTLSELLKATSSNHPSLRVAKGLSLATQQDVEAAKRLRWPELSVVIETDQNKDAASSATRALRLQQSLWDFGRVSALVSEAEAKTTIASHRTRVQEQDLHLQVITGWHQMRNASLRLQYAQQYNITLKGYLAQMQRRVEALASPSIDLELVQSRLLQAQVEESNAQAQLEQSIEALENLSGIKALHLRTQHIADVPSLTLLQQVQANYKLLDWPQASRQHPSVLQAQAEYEVSNRQLDVKKAEVYPQIYFRLDQPLSKTQVNNTNNTKPSWFVGLSYSPGAGFSNTAQIHSQVLRSQAAQDHIEAAYLHVERELRNDHREFSSGISRLLAQQQSLDGTQKVLESYQRQFQAGRKSWLDLLNAAREVNQAQFALADTKAISESTLHRLMLRTQHIAPTSTAYTY